MKQRMLLFFVLITLPFATMAQKLRVAVAANAQFVAEVLAKEFKQQTGINAELIVSSSGKLTTQIEQGAPFDVFLSADMKYPQELYSKQLTTAQPRLYANGTLVLWTKKEVNADMSSLLEPAIQKIAVANPALAPYGEATVQALKNLKRYNALQPKMVFGESISQVNQYLLTGAADAAFTAKSVVLDPAQKDKGNWVEVNAKLYKPVAQGVVIIKASTNIVQAKKFYRFLFSGKAKQIFKLYGYR